jgi:hypothetical protein
MNIEAILVRLLDQGHITVKAADCILNKKERNIDILTELRNNGNISTNEVVLLINENVMVPIVTESKFIPNSIPYTPGYPSYPGPFEINSPFPYCTTSVDNTFTGTSTDINTDIKTT